MTQRIGQKFFNGLTAEQRNALLYTDVDPFYADDWWHVDRAIQFLRGRNLWP